MSLFLQTLQTSKILRSERVAWSRTTASLTLPVLVTWLQTSCRSVQLGIELSLVGLSLGSPPEFFLSGCSLKNITSARASSSTLTLLHKICSMCGCPPAHCAVPALSKTKLKFFIFFLEFIRSGIRDFRHCGEPSRGPGDSLRLPISAMVNPEA